MFKKIVTAGVSAISFLATTGVVSAQSYYSTYGADDLAGGTFFAGFGLIWCCVMCVGFLVPVVCAYVVYTDATKNNVENAALWALLSFFFPIVGILVYFLVGKKK